MTAVEHKSDFELTEVSVSRASYGVLLWGSEVNNIVITLSHCIWILLKYNPLRSNDASASCIIIVEIMASHLLGARPLSKQAGLDPLPTGFKPPTLAQFFLPTPPPPPPPLFPFLRVPPPKIQIFCRRPAHLTPPPPILRQKPPPTRPYPCAKNCANWMRASCWFLCLKKIGHYFWRRVYENIVCEMSALSARPQCLIHWYDLET